MNDDKYFVIRNHTVEHLFPRNYEFSKYQEIFLKEVPPGKVYIWFKVILLHGSTKNLIEEIEHLKAELNGFTSRNKDKVIIIFNLANVLYENFEYGNLKLSNKIAEYNDEIANISNNNIKKIDLNEFFGIYGKNNIFNFKYYLSSLCVISPNLKSKFSDWYENKIRAISSNRLKCVILDLDNTIWGGVIGEDDINKIKIDHTSYPGNAFVFFQNMLLELKNLGIIICICSKNNIEDIHYAWQKLKSNVLQLEDFTIIKANWNEKYLNIVNIIEELGIGEESVMFIDDSELERFKVKEKLKKIIVPEFPKQNYLIPEFAIGIWHKYFSIYKKSDEDSKKTENYKENFKRCKLKQEINDEFDFIKKLNIKVIVNKIKKIQYDRVIQLINKTNQFNLTLKRYSLSQLNDIIKQKKTILCVSVSDKFGDSGLTGLIIIKEDNTSIIIENYLLSCRILGRGIEKEFLKYIENKYYSLKFANIIALYKKGEKNKLVENFYLENNYKKITINTYEKKLGKLNKLAIEFRYENQNNQYIKENVQY